MVAIAGNAAAGARASAVQQKNLKVYQKFHFAVCSAVERFGEQHQLDC